MMDVLAPPLIWVEGECYRFYENHVWLSEIPEIPITSSQKPSLLKAGDYVFDDEASSWESESMIPINRIQYGLDSSLEEESNCNQYIHVEDINLCHEEGNCNKDTCAEITNAVLQGTENSNRETPSKDTKTMILEQGSCNQKSMPKNTITVPVKQSSHTQEFPLTNVKVLTIGNGKCMHMFCFPRKLVARVMGYRGTIIMKVEQDTQTTIEIVREEEICTAKIKGPSIKAVTLARHTLDSLLGRGYQERAVKPEVPFSKFNATQPGHVMTPKWFTHFLSIPVNDGHIVAAYHSVRKSILANATKHPNSVRREYFQKSEKLHINLGMLRLHNEKAIEAAIQALEECNEKIIKPIVKKNGPIKMFLEGLYTPYDGQMTNVIYTNVSSKNDVLYNLIEEICQFLVEKGLMERPRNNRKLLVTLISSRFAIKADKQGSEEPKAFYTFEIFKRHGMRFFGEKVLTAIHLSKRKSYDAKGYYEATSIIRLSD